MDVQMPHMDVYKATQTIRQLSNKSTKPRFLSTALTANAFEEDTKKGGCSRDEWTYIKANRC